MSKPLTQDKPKEPSCKNPAPFVWNYLRFRSRRGLNLSSSVVHFPVKLKSLAKTTYLSTHRADPGFPRGWELSLAGSVSNTENLSVQLCCARNHFVSDDVKVDVNGPQDPGRDPEVSWIRFRFLFAGKCNSPCSKLPVRVHVSQHILPFSPENFMKPTCAPQTTNTSQEARRKRKPNVRDLTNSTRFPAKSLILPSVSSAEKPIILLIPCCTGSWSEDELAEMQRDWVHR